MSKKAQCVKEHSIEQGPGVSEEREEKSQTGGVFQRLAATVKRKLRPSRKDGKIYPHF